MLKDLQFEFYWWLMGITFRLYARWPENRWICALDSYACKKLLPLLDEREENPNA